MHDNTPDDRLSNRGKAAVLPSKDNVIWEVLNNLWDAETNPQGIISLGVAENALMHNELEQFIRKTFQPPQQAFTYGDGSSGSKRLKAAVSRFLNKHLHPLLLIDSDQIIITNGVTTAIEHCAWACGNEGDGFLLGQPYYVAFVGDMGTRAGIEAVRVEFGDTDPLSLEAVGNYEKALLDSQKKGVSIKGLVLCSPHNPLGRCYSRDTLIAIMRLCQKYQIHLISDEIYALSVWKNNDDIHEECPPFISVLSIDLTNIIEPNLVHVLWGMSKDFGANGLRIGFIISQSNKSFLSAIRSVSLYSYPSSMSDHLAANILEDDDFTEKYIYMNQQRLAQSYSFTIGFLKKFSIPYAPGANAAYFVWVNLGAVYLRNHDLISGNSNITTRIMSMLLGNKVFLANGDSFGSEQPGWFRIVFAHPEPYLREGLTRMVFALGLTESNELKNSGLP